MTILDTNHERNLERWIVVLVPCFDISSALDQNSYDIIMPELNEDFLKGDFYKFKLEAGKIP